MFDKLILSIGDVSILGAGLTGLMDTLKNNWIGPVFLIGVMAFALVFIKDRSWTKLLSFVGIAIVVGVLIYAGSQFFGSSGTLVKAGTDIGKQISVSLLPFLW